MPYSLLFISIARLSFFSDGTCGSEQIVSSTSFNCPGGPEQPTAAGHCSLFNTSNILTLDDNYWVTEMGKTGEDQGFILYLGCSKTVRGVSLKNTPNKGF